MSVCVCVCNESRLAIAKANNEIVCVCVCHDTAKKTSDAVPMRNKCDSTILWRKEGVRTIKVYVTHNIACAVIFMWQNALT